MFDDMDLNGHIRRLLNSAPAYVMTPAGTGKTHLLTPYGKLPAECANRNLVLTHTNAGVDAIQKRLQDFKVSPILFLHAHTIDDAIKITPNWDFASTTPTPLKSPYDGNEVMLAIKGESALHSPVRD